MGMEETLPAHAYKELLEQTDDMISVVDERGVIQWENAATERICGYEPGERVGEKGMDYCHPDDKERVLRSFQQIIGGEDDDRSTCVEYRTLHADGSWVWLETTESNKISSAIDGFVFSSREITRRKEYERRLQQERDRLEQFATLVSEDLQTPLTILQNQLDVIRKNPGNSEHLDAMEESIENMSLLVDDLLQIARGSGDRLTLEPVSLAELSNDVWTGLEPETKSLTVQTDIEVLADGCELYRMLDRLFGSAISHGPEDMTVVIGSLENGFFIEDDGRGLFESNDNALLDYGFSRNADGSSFGFSVIAEIVENHGWTLTVGESNTGGARFEITGVQEA